MGQFEKNTRRPLGTGNHFFSASPTNSNNAFVAGSSGRPRSALILLWVDSWAPKTLTGMPALFSTLGEALRLRTGVGMLGNVQDQERRNAFVLGHMRHGGEVAMLRRIVAELLTVTKLRLRLTMHSTTGLCRLDDGRHDRRCPHRRARSL